MPYGSVAFGAPEFDQDPGLVDPIRMKNKERFEKLKKMVMKRKKRAPLHEKGEKGNGKGHGLGLGK